MKSRIIISAVILLLFFSLRAEGQVLSDSTRIYRIETIDGNSYTGNIIHEDENFISLMTGSLGEIKIRIADIKTKTELRVVKQVDGKIWLPNPQSSRYFWAPNGYGLEEGNSYYQNIWVLYNQFSFGVTDNFSLGVGMIPLFLFAGAATPVWVLPKFSIPVVSDKVNIGTGALLGSVFGEGSAVFGLLYETTTLGSRDRNVSLGFAYGFANDNWMKKPIVNLNAMFRLGPKGYFITENYFIPYSTTNYDWYGNFTEKNKTAVIISVGGRTIFKNVGLDYSLWLPVNSEVGTFVAIPFLGITIPLNSKVPPKI